MICYAQHSLAGPACRGGLRVVVSPSPHSAGSLLTRGVSKPVASFQKESGVVCARAEETGIVESEETRRLDRGKVKRCDRAAWCLDKSG